MTENETVMESTGDREAPAAVDEAAPPAADGTEASLQEPVREEPLTDVREDMSGSEDDSVSEVIEELGVENGAGPAGSPAAEAAFESSMQGGQTVETTSPVQGESNIDLLMDVNVTVRVELGRTRNTIGEILNLNPGMLVELDRSANENVDLYLNDKLFATGEVTVVDGNFAIKITRLVSKAERIRSMM